MIKHISILVKGKVQGVFFRASTKEKADEIGITGFVRNRADGSVYIEAEGEETQIDKLVSWCKHGPPRAIVQNCVVEDGRVVGFKDFAIQRG